MTTRRGFVSGMAAAGFGSTAMFRENAVGSLFKAHVIAGDRPAVDVADT